MDKLPFVKMRVGLDFETCSYCNGTGEVFSLSQENIATTKPCFNPWCCDGITWCKKGLDKAKQLTKGVKNEN